jgi:hypothetical protein
VVYFKMKFVCIFALCLACILIALSTHVNAVENSVDADQYYEDYYEDENPELNINNNGDASHQQKFTGFYKSAGTGVVKITKLLLDEEYLNLTAEIHDCVKRVDSGILALEVNATEDEEEEPDITQQVNELRKKMEEVVSVAAALANGTDGKQANASAANETVEFIDDTPKQGRTKRLSFREKQEIRMRERREQEAAREMLRPKFRLGADCETLICGACKAIVEEFGTFVFNAVHDPAVRYVEDLSVGLCEKKEIRLKYVDLVSDICKKMDDVRIAVEVFLLFSNV